VRDAIFLPSNRFLWSLLAGLAGMLNTAGFISVHQFVSHVTGFAGHFAVALFERSYVLAFYALSLPVTFLIGSVFSAYFTEARRRQGKDPTYFPVMFTITAFLFLLGFIGQIGYLGQFGEAFDNFSDFILLAILSFTCGAQNALFTHYSGSVIRTTHLTGLTTDLGIGLVRQFWVKDHHESKFNKIRAELIGSFIVGSVISVYVFNSFEFSAFYLTSLIALGISIRLYRTSKHNPKHLKVAG